MGNVPTTNLNAYYATTTPGNTINSGVIDPALQDLAQTINDNYALFSNFITALELPIPDQSIVTRHIRNSAIITSKLANLGVTTEKLADGSVTLAKLADLVVTAAKIANGTITEPKYADASVSNRALAEQSVTASKLDPSLLNSFTEPALQAQLALRVKWFSNVSVMKADATLSIGQKVSTLGYYAANDGGGADYIIVDAGTGTDDGGEYHNLTGIAGQARMIIGKSVSVRAFGASVAVGIDNVPIIEKMMAAQVTYSFSQTVVKKLFEIRVDGMFELHSPILLRPFIVIRSDANPVQTLTSIGYGFNAVGDFTGKAIIDNAPYGSDGLRKPLLSDSPGNIYDNGLYNPCGNVILENLIIQSDSSYNKTNCAFEAIHLCGANGSIVRSNYTRNTIQGMTIQASWQFEVDHNKTEFYWIGGLFDQLTFGYVKNNYFARDSVQRLTVWSDVSSRPFLTELGSGGTSYLKQKAIGIIGIRAGTCFETNACEAVDYGFGIKYSQNDWAMTVRNTYMEKITTGYIIDTTNSFTLELGMCTVMTNLFDIKLTASDSYGASVPIIRIMSQKGTEFIQNGITNVGTVTTDNTLAAVIMSNFHEARQPSANSVYYDTIYDNVRAIKFYGGNGGKSGLVCRITTSLGDLTEVFDTGNFVPFSSRTAGDNPSSVAANGISVSSSSTINADNRGSWQMANRNYYGMSYRMKLNGGTWSTWRGIHDNRSGTTAQRSTVSPSPEIGQNYFDTTLGKPIWFNGTNWVDATGTTV